MPPEPVPQAPPGIPPGRHVHLPGRGTTFVRELPGPPGAPTVVLLHGLGATAAVNWAASFGPLAERFRVIALDHRGHGRGLRSKRRFRLADCADDVAALLEVLGIERATAVGYSMGGPIAQLLWHRHPERVEALVLCATSRSFSGRWHERIRFAGLSAMAASMTLMPRRAVDRLAEELPDELHVGRPGWELSELRRHDPRTVLEAAEALGRYSSAAWILNVDVPVSVVVTSRDRLVPVNRQVKLALSIPTAVVHVVEGSHLVSSSEPDRFAAVLVEACEQAVGRAQRRRRAAQVEPPGASGTPAASA